MGDCVERPLDELRDAIDELDRNILDLFAQRFAVTDQIGLLKKRQNLPAQDVGRETTQHARLAVLADELGIDANFVSAYLTAMTQCVVKRHAAL